MRHILKITTLLVAVSASWIGILQASIIPRGYTWLLPIYFIITLGCYGLLIVGVGLIRFPTCPHEALLLQQDIVEAREFLKERGVDVSSSVFRAEWRLSNVDHDEQNLLIKRGLSRLLSLIHG